MPTNGRLYQLSHCTYICRYHIVWCTRYRDKVMADKYIKLELKRIFKLICRWKKFSILAWHVGDEHVHLYLAIPPKFSIAYAVCVLKAKSSTWLKKKTKKFPKGSFWSRGYFVSTIGINEFAVKTYIQNQSYHRVELPRLPLE